MRLMQTYDKIFLWNSAMRDYHCLYIFFTFDTITVYIFLHEDISPCRHLYCYYLNISTIKTSGLLQIFVVPCNLQGITKWIYYLIYMKIFLVLQTKYCRLPLFLYLFLADLISSTSIVIESTIIDSINMETFVRI